MEDNIRKSLQIKSVTPKDLEQFNDLLTYVFQVTQKIWNNPGMKKGNLNGPSVRFWKSRTYWDGFIKMSWSVRWQSIRAPSIFTVPYIRWLV